MAPGHARFAFGSQLANGDCGSHMSEKSAMRGSAGVAVAAAQFPEHGGIVNVPVLEQIAEYRSDLIRLGGSAMSTNVSSRNDAKSSPVSQRSAMQGRIDLLQKASRREPYCVVPTIRAGKCQSWRRDHLCNDMRDP